MHPKVLSASGWRILRRLVKEQTLQPWTLAGGTGLALQIGHRYSEDLDFFRPESFDTEAILARMAEVGDVAVQGRSTDTLHVVVGGLRVSFLRHQAPLLFPPKPYRGVMIADIRDIAVMKVVAIGGRGSRKDFVDLFFYLQAGASLSDLFSMLQRRFAGIDYNQYHLLKSLVYFEDAEAEPMPRMVRPLSWDVVTRVLIAEVRRLG